MQSCISMLVVPELSEKQTLYGLKINIISFLIQKWQNRFYTTVPPKHSMSLGLENFNIQNNNMETSGHEIKSQSGYYFLSFPVKRETTLALCAGRERSKHTVFLLPHRTQNKKQKSPQECKNDRLVKFSLATPQAYQEGLLSTTRQALTCYHSLAYQTSVS